MGGCHSDRKQKEDSNSLDEYKVTTDANLNLAEGKEPPSFHELCARQQELVAKSGVLKSAVAQQTHRRSFRSELADIVSKGPRKPVQSSENEVEPEVDYVAHVEEPSTPRVKLSYRRPTLNGTTSPQTKDVVDKYFNTLEELKKFVVSDEIYLDKNTPSTEDKAGDGQQDATKEDTTTASASDAAQDVYSVKEKMAKDCKTATEEPGTADEKFSVDKNNCTNSSAAQEKDATVGQAGSPTSLEKSENVDESLQETPSQDSTSDKKKKKLNGVEGKKSNGFSCFSSEDCD